VVTGVPIRARGRPRRDWSERRPEVRSADRAAIRYPAHARM